MNSNGYQFNASEQGIFVEIYLPKKAEFQGTLYQTLTNGFELTNVKRHFQENREKIDTFLAGHYSCEDRIERMQPVFHGYSLYEVDGVYYNSKDKQISEERAQVIRVMFKLEYEQFSSSLTITRRREIAKDYLRYGWDRKNFSRDYLARYEQIDEAEKSAIEQFANYLLDWESDIALFIFGYLVFEICERINELRDNKGKRAEEEILVTSFWNLTINRVVKLNG